MLRTREVPEMLVAEGRPYPPTGLTTALWASVPVEPVPLAELVTTQAHLDLAALLDDTVRPGSDLRPHVVEHDGVLYLEDGHHRCARAVLRGMTHVRARVLRRPLEVPSGR
jgi:hypothetical protein